MLLSTAGIPNPTIDINDSIKDDQSNKEFHNMLLHEEVYLSNNDKQILKEMIHDYLISKSSKAHHRISKLNIVLFIVNIFMLCLFIGLSVPKIL